MLNLSCSICTEHLNWHSNRFKHVLFLSENQYLPLLLRFFSFYLWILLRNQLTLKAWLPSSTKATLDLHGKHVLSSFGLMATRNWLDLASNWVNWKKIKHLFPCNAKETQNRLLDRFSSYFSTVGLYPSSVEKFLWVFCRGHHRSSW